MGKYYAMILLVLFCLGSKSQSFNENLVKAKNYLNTRVSFFAIQEKAKTDQSSGEKFDKIKDQFSDVTSKNAFNYEKLSGVLKEFSRTLTVLSAKVDSIDLDQFQNDAPAVAAQKLTDMVFEILKKGYSGEYKEISANKNLLITEINQLLVNSDNTATTTTDDKKKPIDLTNDSLNHPSAASDEMGLEVTNMRPAGFFSLSHFNFWTLLPIVVIIVLFVIMSQELSIINERIEQRKKEISSFTENYLPVASTSNASSKTGGEQVINKDSLAEINQLITRLQHRVSALENNISQDVITPVIPLSAKQEDTGAGIFYMAGPVNNYFPNSVKSHTKENTVYKFTLKSNRQEAEYEIHTSGAPVSEIISMVESFIKPACDEENLPNFNVRNIITKKKGVAVLDSDRWIIKSKAIIKYE